MSDKDFVERDVFTKVLVKYVCFIPKGALKGK